MGQKKIGPCREVAVSLGSLNFQCKYGSFTYISSVIDYN